MTNSEILAAAISGKLKQDDAVKLIEANASAVKGVQRAFGIKTTDKGQYAVSGPGNAMPLCMSAEFAKELVAHFAEFRDLVAKTGDSVSATRAAYKQTPEYKASASKMYAGASASKKTAS